MNVWSADEIKRATNGQCTAIFAAKRVHTDSRTIMPGDLFVPLKGEHFDGHEFIAHAFERGAVAALVAIDTQVNIIGQLPVVVVQDTFKALQDLATFNRERCRGVFIGITGSVGKTSTKEMLKIALGTAGEVFATQGNYNNHIGVPLMLANMPRQADFGVFEMGMNHAGEISPLSKFVKPSVAIITNVEAVHLEFFKSTAEIADAKAEIMDGLVENGAIILAYENPSYAKLKEHAKKHGTAKIMSFGKSKKATSHLLSYEVKGHHARVSASIEGQQLSYPLGAVGKHWAIMSVAVLAACHAAGANVQIASGALANFSAGEGRGKLYTITQDGGSYTLIDDCYNASPASMKAAFARMREIGDVLPTPPWTIAVLGDMLELGDSAASLHASLAEGLEQSGIHQVFACGPLMKNLYEALPESRRGGYAANAAALVSMVKETIKPGDLVLIKGSNGSNMKLVKDKLLQSLNL